MSDVAPGPGSRAHRRAGPILLLVAVASLAGWLARVPLLAAMGRRLVAEDPLGPADVLVVSNASVRATALEGAELFAAGLSPTILLAEQRADHLDTLLAERGVRCPNATAQARMILEASGVPPGAIQSLPGTVDGTNGELRAIAAYAERAHPARILYVTGRSHTARAARRLRGELPPGTQVAVRASRYDPFTTDGWWRRRGTTREVLTEYLRWVNTFALGDLWRPAGRPPS